MARPKPFVNGKVALEYLLSELPDPGEIIIFLDINMPVMDGWEFLDQLQSNEQLQAYRVIMVTSSTNDSDRQKAKSYAQISDFFIKPLNIEQLQALV
jgi:CheY-like chemotaxis protein